MQAKRIQNLFDDMKGANTDLTSSAKPPALKADLKDSIPKQSAEDVAETIFAALKNNTTQPQTTACRLLCRQYSHDVQ